MTENTPNIHPVDLYVGERLRQRRKKLNLSQTALGDLVGVSFQQIQKYEQGLNRIPASKLYEFAEVLNAPITYFYEGVNLEGQNFDTLLPGQHLRFLRTHPLNILLGESDPTDETSIRKALEKCKEENDLFVVHDGAELLRFLRDKRGINTFPRPDIVILTLYLKKMDGLTVLKELKRDRLLRDIPVIILTNSVDPGDMISAYKAGASGFIGKTVDEKEFIKNIDRMVEYWSRAVVLPSMQQPDNL